MRNPLFPAAAAALLAPACGQAQQTLVSDGAIRTVDTWAAKGMMQSPVSICLDRWGNLYVAETERAGEAVQDTRGLGHLHAVEDDLQFKSVEDRRAQIHRWLAAGAFEPDYFTRTADRVRVLSDTDGDGIADKAGIFAGPFNDEVDGIGSGVLWLDGTVYYTCIPHLWALPDKDRDLVADSRESLASGFGVRWCFFGHDLHGLVPGPDGRIYFSMGDRGFNVTTREGQSLVAPDQGGVFRCWPDGSGLELFYRGLRNPQELAFSELGDLFTGDNNCDSGDLARIVHIVEGGDSGWRQDVQSLEGDGSGDQNDIHARDSRGPWNREFMWHTPADSSGPGRPAWALPPIEYMCAGPSGLALYPGTGESHAYDGCFFLADFRGGDSSVHAFRCIPDGASFRVADHVEFYKGQATITDIAWGYDGRLYMSDWGGGWAPNPNGVILAVTNTTVHNDATESAAIAQVGELFRLGFADLPANELLALLSHRDQRVRLNAQYSLASRGLAVGELVSIAADANAQVVARAHAIWALGQMARKDPAVAPRIARLTSDADAEVRTQAVRVLGDLPAELPGSTFHGFLADPAPRVRLAAALALAHHGDRTSVGPLLDLLVANDNGDLTLRHAAVFALSKTAKPGDLVLRVRGMSPAARLGAVLALRLMAAEEASEFLDDADPAVAIEAARAVYDLRLASGLPRLAGVLDSDIPADRAVEPVFRRAVEANVLLGAAENAARLATFSMRSGVPVKWRRLALERLLGWDQPLKREGVWGNWADLPARPAADVESAITPRIDALIRSATEHDELIPLAFRLQARYTLRLSAEGLADRVGDASLSSVERLAVLDQLAAQAPGDAALRRVAAALTPHADAGGPLRWRAMQLFAEADPGAAVEPLAEAAVSGPGKDRQRAIQALSSIRSKEAEAAIAALAEGLRFDGPNRETALEVYYAARRLPEDSEARKIAETAGKQGSRPDGYATRFLTDGGDPAKGRMIFLTKSSSECIRCHTTEGPAAATAPSLLGVGARLTPELLVQSVVEPQAVVAAGFGQVSAMPEMTKFLEPREVRDVVAYLKSLDGSLAAARGTPAPGPPAAHGSSGRAPGALSGNGVRIAIGFVLAVGVAFVVWRLLARRA